MHERLLASKRGQSDASPRGLSIGATRAVRAVLRWARQTGGSDGQGSRRRSVARVEAAGTGRVGTGCARGGACARGGVFVGVAEACSGGGGGDRYTAPCSNGGRADRGQPPRHVGFVGVVARSLAFLAARRRRPPTLITPLLPPRGRALALTLTLALARGRPIATRRWRSATRGRTTALPAHLAAQRISYRQPKMARCDGKLLGYAANEMTNVLPTSSRFAACPLKRGSVSRGGKRARIVPPPSRRARLRAGSGYGRRPSRRRAPPETQRTHTCVGSPPASHEIGAPSGAAPRRGDVAAHQLAVALKLRGQVASTRAGAEPRHVQRRAAAGHVSAK